MKQKDHACRLASSNGGEQSGFTSIILILLILVAAGIGGWYLLNQASIKSLIPTPKDCTGEAMVCPDGSAVGRTGPNCEFAPCPGGNKTDEITNWKTYTNTKYEYSIKYPAGKVTEVTQPGETENVSSAKLVQILLQEDEPTLLLIVHQDNPHEFSAKEYVQEMKKTNAEEVSKNEAPLLGISNERETEIGEKIPAYSYEQFAFDRTDMVFWATKDRDAFEFSFPADEDNPNFPNARENFKTSMQILSTFKFTK